jgi:hypothetical protein
MHGFETMFLPVTQHIKGALSSFYERLKRKGLTGAAYFLPLSSLIHARRCMAWHDLPASPARMHACLGYFGRESGVSAKAVATGLVAALRSLTGKAKDGRPEF